MKTQATCPDVESLIGMLDRDLPEVQQVCVTQHVDSCEACQQRLETLVTHGFPDDLDFENVGTHLRNAAKEETTLSADAIQRLTTALFEGSTAFPERLAQISLDFLKASEDPNSLGRLGQFEITEVIGRGGMGIALKGRDTRLDRVVAVKVLAPELASNPTARRRFLREAQAAAAVSHDHVVTTFAVEPGDLPYLAMEYIDGQSLQQKIDRDGPLELREILRMGMQTAYGLAAAHAQGLTHRDIKPSNIMLQNNIERVKITDFGLARAIDDVSITRTGEVTGTPQYMSPEQAQGQPVDHRADLFSLGSVLYAMCTGRSPFRADSTMGVLNRVCNDTPRPIHEVNPDIPDWLAAIIDRLLEKNAEDRLQTAAEVADLLSQCLAHVQQPIVVPLPEPVTLSTSRHNGKPIRRTKWYVGAILLALVVGSLGLTEATGVTQFSAAVISVVRGDGTLVFEVNDPEVSVTIEGADIIITGAGPREVRLRPGQYQLNAQKDGKPVPLEQELVSIQRGGRQVVKVTLRQNEVDYKSVPLEAISEVGRFEGHSYFFARNSLAFTPDGAQVFSGQTGWQRHKLVLWDVATGMAIRGFDDDQGVYSVAISPTARVAASGHHASEGGDSLIQLWNLDTGNRIRSLSGHRGHIVGLDFSPDGNRLISVAAGENADGTARIWDVESGEELVRTKLAVDRKSETDALVPLTALRDVTFAPNGKTFLVARFHGSAVLCNADTGKQIRRFDALKTDDVSTIAFSPDGRHAAVGGGGQYRVIRLYDVDTGKEVGQFSGHHDNVSSIHFTADGRFLVSGAKDKSLCVWDVADQHEVARVECQNHVTEAVAVSPNGKHVISAGGVHPGPAGHVVEDDYTIRLWQLPESVWPEIRTDYRSIPSGAINHVDRLSAHTDTINDIAISTDGTRLLSGGRDGNLYLWDLATHEIVSRFRTSGIVSAVALSSDGTRAGVAYYDGRMRLFDLRGDIVSQPIGYAWEQALHTKPIESVDFSADGTKLISTSQDSHAIVWDAETGVVVHDLPTRKHCYSGSLVSRFRNEVVIPSVQERLIVRDMDTGKEVESIHVPQVNGLGFDSLAFSPDERMIATGHVEGVIRMWNRHDGSLIQEIKGNISSIHSLQFTSDGRHIISGGRDKSIRIFSATDGSEVARVESDRSIGARVRLTPDGRRLITAGGYCYDAQTDKWLADGDYDIHIWQLSESVWPDLSRLEEETGREASRDESQPNDNE